MASCGATWSCSSGHRLPCQVGSLEPKVLRQALGCNIADPSGGACPHSAFRKSRRASSSGPMRARWRAWWPTCGRMSVARMGDPGGILAPRRPSRLQPLLSRHRAARRGVRATCASFGRNDLAVARERAPYLLSRHPVLRASAELLRSLRGLVPHETGRRDLVGREGSQPDATKPAASPRGSSETALRHAIVVRELKQVEGSPSQPFLRSAPSLKLTVSVVAIERGPRTFGVLVAGLSERYICADWAEFDTRRITHKNNDWRPERRRVAFRLSDARTLHRS